MVGWGGAGPYGPGVGRQAMFPTEGLPHDCAGGRGFQGTPFVRQSHRHELRMVVCGLATPWRPQHKHMHATHTQICVHGNIYASTHSPNIAHNPRSHTNKHVTTHTQFHAHTQTYFHTQSHKHTHTNTHSCMHHACTPTHTTHTYTHTHTPTHLHIVT